MADPNDVVVFKDYRRESRSGWGQNGRKGDGICTDQIRLGTELRAADALEKIAGELASIRWRSAGEFEELISARRTILKQRREIKKLKTELERTKE